MRASKIYVYEGEEKRRGEEGSGGIYRTGSETDRKATSGSDGIRVPKGRSESFLSQHIHNFLHRPVLSSRKT